MKPIREHLLERDVDFDFDRIVVNEALNTATFLLFNLSGQMVGYQHYNPIGPKGNRSSTKGVDVRDMKYHSRITKVNGRPELAVYGLHTYNHKYKYLFLVEGIFDCLKLHRLDLPAIAVIASNPVNMAEWLNILPQKKIAIGDRDDNLAGNKLLYYGDYSFLPPKPYGDLGEMDIERVRKFIWLEVFSQL